MPFSPPSRTRPGPRRRSLLAVTSTAVVLAGCSAGSADSGTGTGRPTAAGRARARAARDSAGMAEQYDAVIAAHPGLAGRLRPLREQVVAHAAAFGGTGAASPEPSPSVSPSASVSASPAVSPSIIVPGNEKDALTALAAAERDLADRRSRELLDVPGEVARLLASVAAAGAAHAYLLTEGNR
ncbi:hypothetical protein AB0K80_19995 [Streptomyces sp. NPDC052682]|uniref:hypothetical protein n=1 Tax=Streptomyces sp. NPDC052682 TaxID=3154954 RepID=UPI003441FB01